MPLCICSSEHSTPCFCPACSKDNAPPDWVQIGGVWVLSPKVVLDLRSQGAREQQRPYEQQCQQQYQPPSQQPQQYPHQQSYRQLPAVAAPPAPAPVRTAVRPAALPSAVPSSGAAHGRRVAQQQYPSLSQGMVPFPPKHSEDASVLDHCLDDLQAVAKRDVAEGASEATEQNTCKVARAEGAQWVHIFAGAQCVGSAATSTEQRYQNASEQGPSRVSGPEGFRDEPPCLMQ